MSASQSSEERPASVLALWLVVLVLGAIGVVVVALTAPLDTLLGESQSAIRGAVHGTAAGLFMLTATVGLFQGYRLATGHARDIASLQFGSVMNAMFALFVILSGNWIYIPYRATGGPRTVFLATTPEVHKVFFEFKEFAALFTLPLTVVAAFLLVRYGSEVLHRKVLRTIVAVLLVLAFFYFVVAFGLGAAITKLQSV